MLRRENIAALAFYPLVSSGRLIGKFMVYHQRPHAPSTQELELARAIADGVKAFLEQTSARDRRPVASTSAP